MQSDRNLLGERHDFPLSAKSSVRGESWKAFREPSFSWNIQESWQRLRLAESAPGGQLKAVQHSALHATMAKKETMHMLTNDRA